jgi:photosystem II stability/assembly factor-like uncharacterized protein
LPSRTENDHPFRRLFVSAAVGLALLVAADLAGAAEWTPIGPPGGDVRALAADPKDPARIYLGTSEGVFYRTEDGGGRWNRLSPGFPRSGCSLDEIVVDEHGVVLVGYREVRGAGGGVARSTDGGQSFILLRGMNGESVRALAVAPSNSKVIAAGTLTGVFLSRDGGEHWKRITPAGDPDLRNIESLAFDSRDTRILYAGTWHLAWKTTNSGNEWEPVHQGMIDDSHVMTLTLDGWDRWTVYATACTGIYRSTDAGLNWTKLQGIPDSSRRTRAFAQGRYDPDLLLAGTTEGLWISEDRGGHWRLATSKELVVNTLLVHEDGRIMLGTEGAGVLESRDGGTTWASANNGFSERFVSELVFDPARGRLLAAVWGDRFHGGVFVADGERGAWRRLARGLDGRQVLSLALSGSTIVAGTDDGIYARPPGETTAWTRLPTRVNGQELHPRVMELVALSRRRDLAAPSPGVLSTSDAGRTWTQSILGMDDEVSTLAASRTRTGVVVAATRSGFFRSEDAGKTWIQTGSGWSGATPHAVVFLPSDERVLFTTTSDGLFRSDDEGVTWKRVAGGVPRSDLTGIAVHPDGHTLYVSDFTWGGIFHSTDAGRTWARMPTNGLASDRVWALAIDPESPDRLLAASPAGGLHLLEQAAPGSQAAVE